jgi:hypothetical protein
MSSQRPSFAKREREMKLKDKARAKAERRAARRAEPRSGYGPPIGTEDEAAAAVAAEASTVPGEAGSDPSTSPVSTPDPTRPRK